MTGGWKLIPLHEQILAEIQQDAHITYDRLMEHLGISRSTVKRALSKMSADGRIRRTGGKRYGHWEIMR